MHIKNKKEFMLSKFTFELYVQIKQKHLKFIYNKIIIYIQVPSLRSRIRRFKTPKTGTPTPKKPVHMKIKKKIIILIPLAEK